MKDMQLGVLLPIFLFFVLFAGVIIIYREEIEKMELFGKLHTTSVPATNINRSTDASVSTPSVPIIAPTIISSVSGVPGGRGLSFGDGRIVDATLRDIPVVDLRVGLGSLHTLPSNLNNYYARAFVKEAVDLYDTSPYAGSVVFLDRVSSIKESDPEHEYFVLLFSVSSEKPITITGWKVFDRQGKVLHTFPKGVKILGSDEISLPIVVRHGGRVIVSSGRSPINTSFQVSKCSGYRSQFEEFIPAIKTSCSDPVQEFIEYGKVPFSDDVCYDLVSSLRSCVAVTRIPPTVTKECQDFLEHILLEKGCVSRHRNDANFFTGEWRLFLKSDRELWKNRDNVLYLLDENNLLVATLVYR